LCRPLRPIRANLTADHSPLHPARSPNPHSAWRRRVRLLSRVLSLEASVRRPPDTVAACAQGRHPESFTAPDKSNSSSAPRRTAPVRLSNDDKEWMAPGYIQMPDGKCPQASVRGKIAAPAKICSGNVDRDLRCNRSCTVRTLLGEAIEFQHVSIALTASWNTPMTPVCRTPKPPTARSRPRTSRHI